MTLLFKYWISTFVFQESFWQSLSPWRWSRPCTRRTGRRWTCPRARSPPATRTSWSASRCFSQPSRYATLSPSPSTSTRAVSTRTASGGRSPCRAYHPHWRQDIEKPGYFSRSCVFFFFQLCLWHTMFDLLLIAPKFSFFPHAWLKY